MDKTIQRIVVLIPAFNAAPTIGSLLSRLEPFIALSDVLVIDDGSTDQTVNIVHHSNVRVVSQGKNLGKGAALRKGFDILKSEPNIEGVITLDADLQHRPEDIASFMDKRVRTNAELIIGRRRRMGTTMPWHRRISNSITSFLVSVRTGISIPDSQCGFRFISQRILSEISIDSSGFEAETEFLIKVIKKGFTVASVPIETVYSGEKSNMTNCSTTFNFIKVLFKDY